MVMTKEMSKHQRKAEKEEKKHKNETRHVVYTALVAKDKEILDANQAAKEEEEKQINEEVERLFQEYLQNGEPIFIASRSKRQMHVLQAKNKVKEIRAASIPLILSNQGARKVISEEALGLTEKYRIQRADLGKGTYGFIYRAENPAKKPIAVKVTTLTSLPTQYRFRLQSGFNILRYLKDHRHPNIVPIDEIFESPEKSYVFMETFDSDLFQRIKREAPFKEKDGLKIAKDVGNGLMFLHSIGVAHENLKSHHVLFRGGHDGHAVITGFGWAVVAFDLEKNEVVRQMGSSKQKFHHDFAPEKMKDDLYDPIIADVWSFAALTVSILTKDHPYEPKSAHRSDIQWKLTFKKAGVKLSDRVYEILDKCFTLEPEARATMIDVMDSFDK